MDSENEKYSSMSYFNYVQGYSRVVGVFWTSLEGITRHTHSVAEKVRY